LAYLQPKHCSTPAPRRQKQQFFLHVGFIGWPLGREKLVHQILVVFFEEPLCLIVLELNPLNPIVTPKFKKSRNQFMDPKENNKPNRQSTVE